MTRNKIIVAGGTGFLGNILTRHLPQYEWVVLTRKPQRNVTARQVTWDGTTPGKWQEELENSLAVINLCGRSVDCRYNDKNKKEIINSRVKPTEAIGKAIAQCKVPPQLWMNAASATIYRHSYEPMDEDSGQAGEGFSVDVCRQWETAVHRIDTPSTRKILMRISMVMGREGGIVPVVKRLACFGLGGKMGPGNQYMSWLHEEDFAGIVDWCIRNEKISGPINCSAPKPVTNSHFMHEARKACGNPIGLPAARWMLEAGAVLLQTETELILKSRYVVPKRILASGYSFRFPEIEPAMFNILDPCPSFISARK